MQTSDICRGKPYYPIFQQGPIVVSAAEKDPNFEAFKKTYEESDPCSSMGWEPKSVFFGDVEFRGRFRFADEQGRAISDWYDGNLEIAKSEKGYIRDLSSSLENDWETPVFPKLPVLALDLSPEREHEESSTPRLVDEQSKFVLPELSGENSAFLSYEEENKDGLNQIENSSLVLWNGSLSASGSHYTAICIEGTKGFSRLVLRPSSLANQGRFLFSLSGLLITRCKTKPGGLGYFRASLVIRKKTDLNSNDEDPTSWKIEKTHTISLVRGSPSPNHVGLEGLAVANHFLMSLDQNTDLSFEVHVHKVVTSPNLETSYPCELSSGRLKLTLESLK